MVKIGLKIKATLTNVDKLYTQQPLKFGWPLKVKCTNCGEENPRWHIISQEDKVELANASVNFVYKCKCCSRENSLTIITPMQMNSKTKDFSGNKTFETVYLYSDEDKFKTMICFDCRGLDLIEFEPRDGWAVQSGKKVFEDVDLSTKDWVDYNDIDNVPVEITNVECCFETLK